jgi:hypothetical protein
VLEDELRREHLLLGRDPPVVAVHDTPGVEIVADPADLLRGVGLSMVRTVFSGSEGSGKRRRSPFQLGMYHFIEFPFVGIV